MSGTWALGATLFLIACTRASPASVEAGPLEEGQVLSVAQDTVEATTVRRIQAAQGLSVEAATRAVAFDVLTAAQVRTTGAPTLLHYAERAAATRALLRSLAKESRAEGPPADAEVRSIVDERWWQFDRPELRRTTHAVVRVDEKTDDEAARAVARKVHEAVRRARTRSEFFDAAKKVDPGDLQVRVEPLDPVALDGRAIDPAAPPPRGDEPTTYADDFVRAVFSIEHPGEVSPVVRTEFGYHVILLDEIVEANHASLDEAREALSSEIYSERTRVRLNELVALLRKKVPVSVERSAMALTEKVRVVP